MSEGKNENLWIKNGQVRCIG